MGTRSLTHIHDEGDRILATIYCQFDGYPEGLGAELAEFLGGFTVVNGLRLGQKKNAKIANGMGCLAAQLIKHLKDQPGGVYLYPPGSKDCGEEYTYHVRQLTPGLPDSGGKPVRLSCCDVPNIDGVESPPLFDDTPDKFAQWLKSRPNE